jgi:hypothetical protein
MENQAEFSNCRTYRYALWRTWDESKGKVLFIGLNPSTADEVKDDHTIKRCMSYAKQWGYGGLIMANLFAYRTPYPQELKQSQDPIGPDNDAWLKRLHQQADIVVAMWGNAGSFSHRAQAIAQVLPTLLCLQITTQGQPHHTRGLPNGLKPIPYLD